MTHSTNRKSGLKNPHTKITRRILVATHEHERRFVLEQIKLMVRRAVDGVPQTAKSLRRDHGISLPALSPQWDIVPIAEPNPSQAITAFDGNQAEIRVTLHLDSLVDNTTTMQLEGLGISHLIGISTGNLDDATWQTSEAGGMIALINSPISALSSLLHDVLIDMAMVHAKAQPWSGIRNLLNSHTVAALKAQFVQEMGLLSNFPYGSVGEGRYFPLAAFARIRSFYDHEYLHGLNLKNYVSLWLNFALFAAQNDNLQLQEERESIATQILDSHLNAGQISPSKLKKKIAQLQQGQYCLYFLLRKAYKPAKISELSTFFHVSKFNLRTQHWIIHARDKHSKKAADFLCEGYISVFSFYVGGEL